MKKFLEKLKNKQDLSFDESKAAFEILMQGKASEDEIFDFLTLLSAKGEVSDEIAGGVYVLRNKSKRVNFKDCVDTCGTGGDGMNTLNISTASALLLASMGIKVAKHGNKAVSSKCGSGDVLEALNIKIDLEPKYIEEQINKNNFGFMFAPNYHSAMRFVGPTRKKIGKRTIFNMIGPLSSPALVERQVVGVFDKKLLKIFAEALNNLDIKFAWIVNSEDGLDEISPYAKTNVVQLKDSKISEITIDPKELNIEANKFEDLLGDDAEFNASKMVDIFKGEDNDFSKAVCLNAAAGLIVAEKHSVFDNAYGDARKHILSGKTYENLKEFKMDKRFRKWDPMFDKYFETAVFNQGINVQVLHEILARRSEDLGLISEMGVSIDELKEQISEMQTQNLFFNFKKKIENNIKNNKLSIIAEMKRWSPSAGILIHADKYNPVEIAKIYNKHNATCLSVLTEPNFFGGDFDHIKNIKESGIKLPILCKDFMVNKWQLYLARSRGADAILIILSAFDYFKKEKFLYELYEEALKLNMTVIVETHTIEEAEKALEFKEALIGINNRNLKTLKTDINTTYNINNALKNFSGSLICESGIKTKEELLDINFKTKINTFLIGESLLKNLKNNSIFSVL